MLRGCCTLRPGVAVVTKIHQVDFLSEWLERFWLRVQQQQQHHRLSCICSPAIKTHLNWIRVTRKQGRKAAPIYRRANGAPWVWRWREEQGGGGGAWSPVTPNQVQYVIMLFDYHRATIAVFVLTIFLLSQLSTPLRYISTGGCVGEQGHQASCFHCVEPLSLARVRVLLLLLLLLRVYCSTFRMIPEPLLHFLRILTLVEALEIVLYYSYYCIDTASFYVYPSETKSFHDDSCWGAGNSLIVIFGAVCPENCASLT